MQYLGLQYLGFILAAVHTASPAFLLSLLSSADMDLQSGLKFALDTHHICVVNILLYMHKAYAAIAL